MKAGIAACIINEVDMILPYSVGSTISLVEEWADKNLAAGWKKHKSLGAKIENVLIVRGWTRDEVLRNINDYFDHIDSQGSELK